MCQPVAYSYVDHIVSIRETFVRSAFLLFLVLFAEKQGFCQTSYYGCTIAPTPANISTISSFSQVVQYVYFPPYDYEAFFRVPKNYNQDIIITHLDYDSSTPACMSCAGDASLFWNQRIIYDVNGASYTDYTGPSQITWSGPNIIEKGYSFYVFPIDKYVSMPCHIGEYRTGTISSIPYPQASDKQNYAAYAKVKAPTVTSSYNFFFVKNSIVEKPDGKLGYSTIRRAKITLLVGDDLPPVTIRHLHEVPESRAFRVAPRLLAKDTIFKVCADGSEASVFEISGGNYDYTKLQLRIKESNSINDSDSLLNGRLKVVLRSKNFLRVRYRNPDFIEKDISSKILTIGLLPENNSFNTAIASYPLMVYRAPVLMVHGFMSDSSGFKKMQDSLSLAEWPKFSLFRANYKRTSKKSFSVNSSVLPERIDSLINQLVQNGVAAGRVDVIGHSMGGLLTRLYLQSADYKNDIHKLITLNTPHAGSQFANISRDISKINPLRNMLINIATIWLDEGAVTDLAVDSPNAIRTLNTKGNSPGNLNYHKTPTHAVTTIIPYSFNNPGEGFFFRSDVEISLAYLLSINLNENYGETTHDLVVPQSSQSGGLSGDCVSTVNNQKHSGSMQNNAVIGKVMYLLRQPTGSSNFCKDGYAPPALTYKKVFSIPEKPVIGLNARIAATASVKISQPIKGKVVESGSTVEIKATGSDLASLWLFIDYSVDSAYTGYQKGNAASISFFVDKRIGKRSIVAVGKTLAGEYVSDTTHIYVVNAVSNNACNSLKSGDWTSSSTWSCGHEPTITDIVTINSQHVIAVSSSTAQANRIIYKGGVIKLTTISAKLLLKGGG